MWELRFKRPINHAEIFLKNLELILFHDWCHLMTSPMDKPIQSLKPCGQPWDIVRSGWNLVQGGFTSSLTIPVRASFELKKSDLWGTLWVMSFFFGARRPYDPKAPGCGLSWVVCVQLLPIAARFWLHVLYTGQAPRTWCPKSLFTPLTWNLQHFPKIYSPKIWHC